MTGIDVLVPVLWRPQNAQPFMDSIAGSYDADDWDLQVTSIANTDDVETGTAWYEAGAHLVYTDKQPGSFAQKVNVGYESTQREWLFLVGDDVRFHQGWLEAALQHGEHAVIGTNDLGNGSVIAGQHATHMFIRRDFVDECGSSWDGPGVVAHEGYRHCYVDDEIVYRAKQCGEWIAALDSVVEHLHPAWGKAPGDDTYNLGGSFMGADGETFRARVAQYG